MLTEKYLTKEKIKNLSQFIPNLEEELELIFQKGVEKGMGEGYREGWETYKENVCGYGYKCPYYSLNGKI